MSDEQAPPKEEESSGAPAWVMTFADLMSLLMCFFVLLLAFSEMDVQKFKTLSGSMKNAFGVQRDVRAFEIPKGTSVVKQEFSAGKPAKTLRNQVRQDTTRREQKHLATQKEKTKKAAQTIAQILKSEVKGGRVQIQTEEKKIIIRVLEESAFPVGLAKLNKDFIPVILKLRKALKVVDGKIRVGGHTDDIPINTHDINSNWQLSAKRAIVVVHALADKNGLPAERFEVGAYAHTKPLVPNTSAANRAKNRRVEIVVIQGEDKKGKAMKVR
jgi:chemotaxis protein MotB